MNNLAGTVRTDFESVRDVVARHLSAGDEVGLSLAVDLDSERVVDLWGGHRDAGRSRAWQRDTVTNVWSITKTVTSLAALLLVEAGELDVDAPVARYWPEFAANGKARVEVRHLLSHTSGVSGLAAPATLADLYDVRAAAERMAAQPPWWPPGTASGYHVLNYGHLIGEIVHRITGSSLRDFVRDRLATPLGADFRLGLDAGSADRVADIIVPELDFDPESLDHDSVAYRTLTGPRFAAEAANTPGWRAADLGGANGHGNAASVARMLSPLLAGDGAGPSLGPDTSSLIFRQQSDGVDLVNGMYLRWGIGFALPDPRTLPWLPAGRIAFWGGWGGSMAIVDFDRRLVISYVMNRMDAQLLGSNRAAAYVGAVYDALGRS